MPLADVDYVLEPFDFQMEPMDHQKRCLLWALTRDRLAYWLDVGTGKTLLALYTLQIWGCEKALVICPKSVIQTWVDEAKAGLGCKVVVLAGTAKQRRLALKKKAKIYVINYEGLHWLWGKKVKKQFKPNLVSMSNLGFDMLIIDEVHRVKSPSTLVQRLCHALSKRTNHCVTLTGTPLTNDQKDLWGEMHVMDLGRSLGTNYYGFVRKYFWQSVFDWILKDGALPEILEKVAENTIRFERSECFDLPEKTYEKRYIDMSPEQVKLSKQVIGQLPVDDPRVLLESALNCGKKLSQIAGGFYYTEDGETIRLKSNPKLAELMRLLEEISGKVIVFHQFIAEGRMISEALTKAGISHSCMRSETKDKEKELDRFMKDPDTRVLVAHPRCGGEGLNLQMCSNMIFYSNGYSHVVRTQAEGRVYRKGQTEKCLFIDLVANDDSGVDGIDHRILRCLDGKRNMAQEVLDYLQGLR